MLKFTNLDDAVLCLKKMGNQFVCPPDGFFIPLANSIESLEKAYEMVRNAAYDGSEKGCPGCLRATKLRDQADKIRYGDQADGGQR